MLWLLMHWFLKSPVWQRACIVVPGLISSTWVKQNSWYNSKCEYIFYNLWNNSVCVEWGGVWASFYSRTLTPSAAVVHKVKIHFFSYIFSCVHRSVGSSQPRDTRSHPTKSNHGRIGPAPLTNQNRFSTTNENRGFPTNQVTGFRTN